MNWYEMLVNAVEKHGRRQVEADTGLSKTTLSLVLNKKYPGNLGNIEQKVIAAYSASTVTCPVLGDIQIKRCMNEQQKPFSHSNPQRVRLFRACKTCPHRNG